MTRFGVSLWRKNNPQNYEDCFPFTQDFIFLKQAMIYIITEIKEFNRIYYMHPSSPTLPIKDPIIPASKQTLKFYQSMALNLQLENKYMMASLLFI